MASQALMVSPWGFDPQQIAVLTHIWLGEDDGREMRPPPLRHYTGVITAAPTEENSGRTRWSPSPDALRLAAAFAVIVGHMSIFYNHAPDILGTLVAQP